MKKKPTSNKIESIDKRNSEFEEKSVKETRNITAQEQKQLL